MKIVKNSQIYHKIDFTELSQTCRDTLYAHVYVYLKSIKFLLKLKRESFDRSRSWILRRGSWTDDGKWP